MVTVTWITVVILELIHASRPDFEEGLCLLDTKPIQVFPDYLVIHDNCYELNSLGCQCIIQVSDLSASDGRVLAYRGNDG